MEGVIVHYRQNRHTTDGNHVIVRPEGCDSREQAEQLVGKTVKWHTGKRDLVGNVASAHGNSGAVRVLFDKGVPGQALGQKVSFS
ncbi:50S ribosomal protein L35ae [Candidatus Woesearchaeota archaeon]|nr:50S ribosomal protein L35ae [Candidatus Woesearchaeota archaeon]